MTIHDRGEWLQTHSGKTLHACDAAEDELDIEDIARGLREPRFAGQTDGPYLYTVAEHSVRASYITPPEHALAALLHDAHEFVYRDLPAPVKRHKLLRGYKQLAEQFQWVINCWAGLDVIAHRHDAVHHADMVMLATEKRDLMGPEAGDWGRLPDPLPGTIVPWTPNAAMIRFLERYYELRGI